jgi:hypothetical protein
VRHLGRGEALWLCTRPNAQCSGPKPRLVSGLKPRFVSDPKPIFMSFYGLWIWLRGAISAAWCNISCVVQYHLRGAVLAACCVGQKTMSAPKTMFCCGPELVSDNRFWVPLPSLISPERRAPAPAQANPHLRSSPAQSATPPAGRAANEGPFGTQRVRLLRLGSASGERTVATRFMSVPLLGHVLHARATGGAASLALLRCGAGVPNGAQLGTSPRPLFEMESLARPAEAAGSKNSR